jgi:CBS domain containing-hemolysin-like protein
MERIDKVPETGDSFLCDGWRVTVTATDERRIKEIRVEQANADAIAYYAEQDNLK